MRDAGSGGRYAGLSSATRALSTRIERVHPIRSPTTVAGIVGYARSNSRIRGSTPSTIDPAGRRWYFGGVSEASATRTVLREIPNTRATCEIDIPSARHSRRISAQSSTVNTHFLPGSDRARLSAQVIRFRVPRPVQFSAAADTEVGAGSFDEVGYIPFDHDAANLFFQLVASRYEQASVMVTSNLPFGRWGEVFGDEVVAAAMIDRLVHHAEVLTLAGDSYRTRARRQLLAKDRDK